MNCEFSIFLFVNLEWFFDGLGTEIISIIIGFVIGGFSGYNIGIKKNITQHQKAKDNANQVQIGRISGKSNSESRK